MISAASFEARKSAHLGMTARQVDTQNGAADAAPFSFGRVQGPTGFTAVLNGL